MENTVTLHYINYGNRHKSKVGLEMQIYFLKIVLQLCLIDCEPKDNADFVSYVRQQGYDAHAQIYADYPNALNQKKE